MGSDQENPWRAATLWSVPLLLLFALNERLETGIAVALVAGVGAYVWSRDATVRSRWYVPMVAAATLLTVVIADPHKVRAYDSGGNNGVSYECGPLWAYFNEDGYHLTTEWQFDSERRFPEERGAPLVDKCEATVSNAKAQAAGLTGLTLGLVVLQSRAYVKATGRSKRRGR